MIGHKIAQVLENKNHIIGTSRKSIEPIDLGLKSSKIIYKDFAENTDFNFLENLMPDIIINCVGITTRRINNTNISQLEFINSKLPHILEIGLLLIIESLFILVQIVFFLEN